MNSGYESLSLMVTPTHVGGVSKGEPMPLVDLIEVTGDRAGKHASHRLASSCLRAEERPASATHNVRLRPLGAGERHRRRKRPGTGVPHRDQQGSRRGTEVVQLYAADTATGVTLPPSSSLGSAGSTSSRGPRMPSRSPVPLRVLGYMGISGEFVMEPGPVELSAGSSPASAGPPRSPSPERPAPSKVRSAHSSR